MLRWSGRTAGRVLHWLGRILLGLAIVIVLGVGALAWRLSQGPIALPWLAHRIEAAFNEKGGPTRLAIGQAALEWEGFRLGVDHPLDLRLTAIRVTDAKGATLDEVARVAVSVSLASLLVGHVAPRTIEADGARLHLVRAADGTISLDIGSLTERLDNGAAVPARPARPAQPGQPARQSLLAELSSPPQSDASRRQRGQGAFRLGQLRRVLIRDAAITVTDGALGTDWRVDPAALDLTRAAGGGVTGHAELGLAIGDATARLTAEATLAAGGASTRLTAHLSPLTPAVFARAWSRLAPLAGVQVPLGADLTAELGPDLALRHFVLNARAGAGQVQFGSTAEAVSAANLTLQGDLAALQLQTLHLALAGADGPAGPALDATGTLTRQNGRFTAHAGLALDRVAFADLAHYWPAGLGGGARPWITQNITAGIAHDGQVQIALEGPADLSDVRVTSATGQIQGDDLTVHWLRPLPPIEHTSARLTLVSPDAVEIASKGGRVTIGKSGIALDNGAMRIWGLTAKDQPSTVAIGASGAIPDLVALLSNPRLHLLSDHPIPVQNPSGSFSAKLDVQLPLDKNVTIEQIGIKARAKLAAVHLGNVAAGRDLDGGAFDLAVDNNGLTLGGTAQFAHIPSQLDVALDFRSGPPSQITTRVKLSGTASADQLKAAGLDMAGIVQGTAKLDADYAEARSGSARLQAKADLQGAAIDTGPLGWTKRAGEPASAAAQLVLDHGRLTAVNGVTAQGPGLAVTGRADVANGAPHTLLIQHCVIGRTEIAGQIVLAARPGDAIRADLHGPQIDLSGQLRGGEPGAGTKPAPKPAGPERPGPPWQVQGRFDRVLLAGEHAIGPLSVTAQSDGRVIRAARVETTGAVRILATIAPGPGQSRLLSVTAGDTGSMLQALDITSAIRGGQLTLSGQFDDRRSDHPLTGNADLAAFRFANAPAIARVLQAMTLYGLVGALRGPGLAVDRLVAPFRLQGDVLTLEEARAYNSALGVTAKGDINLAAQTADLQGTIVPAYMINSFLGNIPLIGRLFSPERGGGLFAVNYSVRGRLADPAVSVNPLSALTPGFLRGLFGIFRTAPAH